MTNSLGRGRIDDSTAMRAMIPGYPIPRNRFSSQLTNDSSIESMLSDQGNESRGAERRVAELGRGGALDQREDLGTPLPQRNEEPAVRRQLLHERRRNLGTARCDEDGVVGRVCAPPQGAVADVLQRFGNP